MSQWDPPRYFTGPRCASDLMLFLGYMPLEVFTQALFTFKKCYSEQGLFQVLTLIIR